MLSVMMNDGGDDDDGGGMIDLLRYLCYNFDHTGFVDLNIDDEVDCGVMRSQNLVQLDRQILHSQNISFSSSFFIILFLFRNSETVLSQFKTIKN